MLVSLTGRSQSIPSSSRQVPATDNYSNQITITDANGRPFKPVNEDILGSPFFIDSMKIGSIKFSDGRNFSAVKMRLDLYRQEVHVLSRNNEEFILPNGLVRQLVLLDSSAFPVKEYNFKTGYPVIDNQTSNTFYLVLTEGNISLLRFIQKRILNNKNDVSGETSHEYETYDVYYLFADNKMIKLRKEKEFVLQFMKGKEMETNDYLKMNKTNFRKINEIQALLEYYNSLK